MTDYSELDTELLAGYLANLNPSVLQQMIDLYQQQVEGYLAQISASTDAEQQQQWQEHCHKMKGAAGSVGFTVLNKYLASIEKDSSAPAEKIAFIEQLKTKNQQALEQFSCWLSEQ